MKFEVVDTSLIKNEVAGVLEDTTLRVILDDMSGYVANGKMLRGKIPLYLYQALSKSMTENQAAKSGAAIEMIHAASLLHDDVIDNSDLRRGVPSFWAAKGVQGAILFGDMLMCRAFKLINDSMPEKIGELIQLTSSVCEAEVEQELISKGKPVTYDESIFIAREKTGALFAFAAASCGGSDVKLTDALRETGYRLGTAYQLADDVLDEFGDAGDSDKPLGNDRKAGKATLANNDKVTVNLSEEIEVLYNSYTELLKEWPDVMAAWMAYLDTEFKPIVDKFLKNYINR